MYKYFKLKKQLRQLETEQVLGRSVSEDIRQELEKEMANSKLTYDLVCEKPIDSDFILVKQTSEHCRISLEEFFHFRS